MTYARVSSHDQKQDLVRQSTTLHAKALQLGYKSIQQIEDLGSGLNYKKRCFVKLLDLIFNHEFEILIVNHKDRLLRFGVDLIDRICLHHGVKLIVLEDKTIPFEEELTRDVIELMTVFCARLYGKRSHKNKFKLV